MTRRSYNIVRIVHTSYRGHCPRRELHKNSQRVYPANSATQIQEPVTKLRAHTSALTELSRQYNLRCALAKLLGIDIA